MKQSALSLIPSIDSLLIKTEQKLQPPFSKTIIKEQLQKIVSELRREWASAPDCPFETREQITELILHRVQQLLNTLATPSLRHVINATGIILHTGLGRAPLPPAAQENLRCIAAGYSNLEFDLKNGKRGERSDHVRELLRQLTGAEDALVVNNNAAAVFLCLNTMAFGKEAIISRGQLIEIGGSFRLPEIMQQSGCIMREIGTTNKTKSADYRKAIVQQTGVVVVAHTSNYRVMGFVEEVPLQEVVAIAREGNLPVLHDLGGGVIVDLRKYGLPYEPLVQDSVLADADVITFSGDKVLGGPQSGIIVGKRKWLEKIHRNPIMRAVRCDKLSYAALEATLQLFLDPEKLPQNHPTLRLLTAPIAQVRSRAEDLRMRLTSQIQSRWQVTIESTDGQTGSGALPLQAIPSVSLVLSAEDMSAQEIAAQLRRSTPPVVGYIQNDRIFLDMRTVLDEELEDLASVINRMATTI